MTKIREKNNRKVLATKKDTQKSWTVSIIIIAFLFVFIFGSAYMNKKLQEEMVGIQYDATLKFSVDKSMYDPGETIILALSTSSNSLETSKGKYLVNVKYLNETIDTIEGVWETTSEGSIQEEIEWTAPNEDFKGYLFELDILDSEGHAIRHMNTAADVSSTWTKFPRYGFLTNFDKDIDTEAVIEQMNDWQLNGIEYYDWKYLHHQLIPEDGTMEWQDWAGRKISGETIKSYIAEAKARGMTNMSYNMIYAATNNYAQYGIKEEWGLWYAEDHEAGKNKGDRFTFSMGASPTGQSNLFFFDIQNPEWQNYIIQKNLEALQVMGFDGWHGDTVGEWGKMWTHDMIGDETQGIYVKDGYKEFLDIAKEKLDSYYLSFNPVGAQGIEQVNASAVDVLYAEIWPWDTTSDGEQYNTYQSLKNVIDNSRDQSDGKSLIIPAYMEYDYAESVVSEPFNMSAVLLTDAAVYAAGGSRIELGDGDEMLSNEYFPKHNLYMSDEHKVRQKALQNFIVAYQNLLRDGLEDNDKLIEIVHHNHSENGDPNTIWTYSKSGNGFDTIQIINLLGVSDNDWRANDGKKETPTRIENVVVKYYTDDSFESAWVTSPDPAYDSVSKELSLEYGSDEKGSYVRVSAPSLEYWDMIYFSHLKK